jgi:hypothetical protein
VTVLTQIRLLRGSTALPGAHPTGRPISSKLVSNLWILWKTQDSRLWNLWITPPGSLLPQEPFVIIGPSQEPVHNYSAHLESNRLAAHIYHSSTLTPHFRGSRFKPPPDSETPVAGANAVSTVSPTGVGGFPHSMGAFQAQTRFGSRQTAPRAFIPSTKLSTHVESAVDKIETSRSGAVSTAESGGKNCGGYGFELVF